MKIALKEKSFLIILLIITIIFTVLIFYPFLSILVLSASFAVVLHPVYLWIKKYLVKNISWLASLITIIIFLLGLCVPLFFIGKEVLSQTENIYYNIINMENSNNFFSSINSSVNKLLPEGFSFDVNSKIMSLVSSLSGNIAQLFSSTLNSIFLFALMIFTLFYLLKDGEKFEKGFINIFPLRNDHTKEIISDLKISINKILKGSFIIAIAQGALAWVGFVIFGIPNAIIWAIVAGIASFVPNLGTSIVSIPAILFLFFTGMQIQALGLLIWSALLIGMIDNFLAPYIISKDTNISSLFILFAILGGISFAGPIGIIIGPLVLSLLYSLISIYKRELQN